MGMWLDISFAEVVVDDGGTSILLNVLTEGLICYYALATQSLLSPTLGAKSVT